MSAEAKTYLTNQWVAGGEVIGRDSRNAASRSLLLAFACGALMTVSSSYAAVGEELAPRISDTVHEEIKVDGKDVAFIVAVDDAGNYKVYRGKQAETARELTFPTKELKILDMKTIYMFKTNPSWCVGGPKPVCVP